VRKREKREQRSEPSGESVKETVHLAPFQRCGAQKRKTVVSRVLKIKINVVCGCLVRG
jgi:hypothetical protein